MLNIAAILRYYKYLFSNAIYISMYIFLIIHRLMDSRILMTKFDI